MDVLRSLVLFAMHTANNLKGSRVEFTFPGTNWCGPGNFSGNGNALGFLTETDNCCRDHDHCPWTIMANHTKFGLTNHDPYTRTACECDIEFYACLKNVQSSSIDNYASNIMGKIYFTLMEDKCFEEKSVEVKCASNERSENCTFIETKEYEWKIMPSFEDEEKFFK